MKKSVLSAVLVLVLGFAQAQKTYFVYLQSESGSPFYARLADKIYSSSASGYLIIPQLKDSTYVFSVGVPKSQVPEAKFSIAINQEDRGYLLKGGEEGPSLFDMKSLALLKPVVSGGKTVAAPVQRTDSFTRLLSQAADDPDLLTTSVTVSEAATAKKEESPHKEKGEEKKEAVADVVAKKTEEAPVVPRVDTTRRVDPQAAVVGTGSAPVGDTAVVERTVARQDPPVKQEQPVKEETKVVPENTGTEVRDVKTETAVRSDNATAKVEPQKEAPTPARAEEKAEEPFLRSVVVKRSESSTTEGFGLVFLDNEKGVVDTIRILIPNPKVAIRNEAPAEEKGQFLDISAPKETKEVKETPPPAVVAVKEKEPRSACTSLARENDFFRLRKNMAARESDDAMLAEARKAFRSRCYTTEQVRNLSALFLTNEGKYRFFDTAFGHVSDPDQFPTLQSEIKDAYFLKRFNALTGN